MEEYMRMAIEKYGEESQILMLAEEASELAVAAHHYVRGREFGLAEIVEEIADVEIMIEQAKIIVPSLREIVEDVKVQKIERLKKMLEDGKYQEVN
jgi:NTP pyrophosphatase (non-canonical NTP hydrolase)